jgi:hypothetical protein
MENKDSLIATETDETDEIELHFNRTILRSVIVTAGFSVLNIIGFIFYRTYNVHILLTATVIFAAYCSYTVGCRWQKIDHTIKLAFLATICVFTIIGFLIAYYLAPIPDFGRLVVGLGYAIIYLCANVVSALIGFYIK